MKQGNNLPGAYKRLGFITLALITGAWFFILEAKFFIKPAVKTANDTFFWVFIAIGTINLLASVFLYNHLVKSCRKKEALIGKLSCFQTVYLIRMALIEGVALFGVVGYMVTGDERLWAGAVLFGLVMIWYYPRRQVIVRDLELSAQEEMMLE